jgi:hypothetical protein
MTSNESVEMENEPADDASVDSFELEDSNPLDVSAVLADEVQLRETATALLQYDVSAYYLQESLEQTEEEITA